MGKNYQVVEDKQEIYDEIIKDLGKMLRKIRLNRGFSQKEVADALDATPQCISAIECGRKPSVPFTVMLADFFNISLDMLFQRTENVNPFSQQKLRNTLIEIMNKGCERKEYSATYSCIEIEAEENKYCRSCIAHKAILDDLDKDGK